MVEPFRTTNFPSDGFGYTDGGTERVRVDPMNSDLRIIVIIFVQNCWKEWYGAIEPRFYLIAELFRFDDFD